MRPSVRTCFKLPSRGAIGLGHNLAVIRWVGRSLHPGTPGHTSCNLQQGGITQVNITARSVETQGIAKSASSSPSRSDDVTSDPMTRGIAYRRPTPFVKIVSHEQPIKGVLPFARVASRVSILRQT